MKKTKQNKTKQKQKQKQKKTLKLGIEDTDNQYFHQLGTVKVNQHFI